MVPVDIRSAAKRLELGNEITSLFVELPVESPDPLRRYAAQVEQAESLKSGSQATRLARADRPLGPRAAGPALVPGPRALLDAAVQPDDHERARARRCPLYAFGSRMRAIWPLVPLAAEHALGLAVFSYDGRLFFCFNARSRSVPELDWVARARVPRSRSCAAAAGQGTRRRLSRCRRSRRSPIGALSPERFRDVLGDRYKPIELGIERGAGAVRRAGGLARQLDRARRRRRRAAALAARLRARRRGRHPLGGDRRRRRLLRGHQAHPQPPARRRRRRRRARRGASARSTSARSPRPPPSWRAGPPRRRRLPPRPADRRPGRRACARPGAVVVWRCHVGLDLPNADRPRRLGLPAALRRERRRLRLLPARVRLGRASTATGSGSSPPSIDAFSPKNQELAPEQVARDPEAASGSRTRAAPDGATFVRADGTPGPGRPRRPS